MITPFDAIALAVREAVSLLAEERPDLPTIFSTSPGVLDGDLADCDGEWSAVRLESRWEPAVASGAATAA